MKVRDIIKCLQDFHDLDEELIVAWWDKASFDHQWTDQDGNLEPVPEETWDTVASTYVENEYISSQWNEDIYHDLRNYHERDDA